MATTAAYCLWTAALSTALLVAVGPLPLAWYTVITFTALTGLGNTAYRSRRLSPQS